MTVPTATMASALTDMLPSGAVADAGARWSHLGAEPLAVVSPASSKEAATVLRWANREGVGVVCAASGRACLPPVTGRPVVVLSTQRLTGFEIYEPADLTFTAGAGTPMAEVSARLAEQGQWLPFDPPGIDASTLGGLVAAGESGPLWMGYGGLRNHVLGMTIVTGDGRVLRLGGRVVKNVAGFDLIKPMVGSRGRLALITSVCMRAFPEPAQELRLVHRGADRDALLAHGVAVGTATVLPVSCVVAWGPGADGRDAEPRLSIRLHGAPETVDADRGTLERHLGIALDEDRRGTRDRTQSGLQAPDAVTELAVSVRPSQVLRAVEAVDPLEPASVSVDTYAARLRIALDGFDPSAIAAARDRIEALGGALSIRRAPTDADRSVASTPTEVERALGESVARVFDPHGVLRAAVG